MIKYVFWDFNGTILDDRQLSLDLLNEILKKQNKKNLIMDEYLEVFGFPIKDYYMRSGVTFENESFEEMAEWFIKEYQPKSLKLSIHKDVEETLIILQKMGIKNIVLSASQQDNLEEQIEHFGLTKYFYKILGIDNIHALGKEEVGRAYIKKEGISPKECLYVGDTTYDFELSHRLGIMPLLFTGGHQSKEKLLTKRAIVIDDMYDIIDYINKERRRNKMRKFFKDFGAFISKGNILDLAVGVIIGGAFNAIIKSLVGDLLMPVISLMVKGDIKDQFLVLRGTAEWVTDADGALVLQQSTDAVLMYWGRFLQNVIDFLIIGLTLFIIVKVIIRLQKRAEQRKAAIRAKRVAGQPLTPEEEEHEPEPQPSEEVLLLREIRDSLQKREE